MAWGYAVGGWRSAALEVGGRGQRVNFGLRIVDFRIKGFRCSAGGGSGVRAERQKAET
jgi:hypothetical protein